jgi:hypothetical protein
MIYDAVVPVAKYHRHIGPKVVRSLRLFTSVRDVLVVTSRELFPLFEGLDCEVVDEDIPADITRDEVAAILVDRCGEDGRAGWYLQQFCKMAMANWPGIAPNYLIWDGDTILLKPLEFVAADGSVFINPRNEYHRPYFELMRDLLGIDRVCTYSFIAEHLLAHTETMSDLVGHFEPAEILHHIEARTLPHSGFSEYETYGNFAAARGHRFTRRPLRTTRMAKPVYGMNPGRHDILSLMLKGYAYASFESWQPWPSSARRSDVRLRGASRWMMHQGEKICDLAEEVAG